VEKYGQEFALQHPVGCGPYVMSEYKPKQRIVLTANPNRHHAVYPTEGMPGDREAGLLQDAGKTLPLNEKIVFSIIKESVTAWNLFQQGYLDAAAVTNENYQQAISRAGTLTPQMKERGIRLNRDVQANIYYFAFNMNDPVVGSPPNLSEEQREKNRKLRQAISLSIDAQAYIDLFSQGIGKPAEFIVPPGVFGYDPNYKNPYRRYDPNLTRAKQLLAEAGYPGGTDPKTGQKFVLGFDNTAITPAGRLLVGLVTKQVERLGIRLDSRATRPNVFQEKVDKGQFQFIRYGWFADYPDPENFVFLLYGPNKRPGPNASGYDNPQYNALFEKMRALEDGPERQALLTKMREIAVEDTPWIYINHDENLSLYYDWLTNVKSHPIANDTAQYRGVDAKRRVDRQQAWNQPNFVPLAALVGLLVAGAIPAVSVVRRRQNRRVRRTDMNTGNEG
jgi:ABC-type transport system substrate-binding protein